jgi:hypothetical protein
MANVLLIPTAPVFRPLLDPARYKGAMAAAAQVSLTSSGAKYPSKRSRVMRQRRAVSTDFGASLAPSVSVSNFLPNTHASGLDGYNDALIDAAVESWPTLELRPSQRPWRLLDPLDELFRSAARHSSAGAVSNGAQLFVFQWLARARLADRIKGERAM